jgi:hypothetical protein
MLFKLSSSVELVRYLWKMSEKFNIFSKIFFRDVGNFVRYLCVLVLRHQMRVSNYFVNSFYSVGPFRIFSKIRGNIRRSRLTTGINDTGGKQWEQYQAADTLKWTWRQKIIYMLSLLSKGVPTKLFKFFWLKIFFICHRCQRHRWSTLSCEYLREFSKKFETVLIGHSGVGGKLIHTKNQQQKISWHCPFKIRITARVLSEIQ